MIDYVSANFHRFPKETFYRTSAYNNIALKDPFYVYVKDSIKNPVIEHQKLDLLYFNLYKVLYPGLKETVGVVLTPCVPKGFICRDSLYSVTVTNPEATTEAVTTSSRLLVYDGLIQIIRLSCGVEIATTVGLLLGVMLHE